MTDREMLELAASHCANGPRWSASDPFKQGPMVLACGTRWNPLDDDGDAFRLSCSLDLIIDIDHGECVTRVDYTANHEDFVLHEDHAGDPLAATRRAIVRAAAGIGRAMP